MRKFFLLAWISLLNISESDAQSIYILHNPDHSTDTLDLVFKDDFNGDKLDEQVWNVVEGVPRDPECTRAKAYYTGRNIEVKDGVCRLIAKRDTLLHKTYSVWVKDGMKPYTQDFHFTSAEMNTRKKYGYGVYEIRCKIPRGKGLSPAFWMYGATGSVNSEIDVFEFWNERNFLRRFSKRKLSRKHQMSAHYNGRMTGKSYLGPEFADRYYVFTVVWDECRIEWYVNGELKRRITRYKQMDSKDVRCADITVKDPSAEQHVFPHDENMSIIATLAVHTGEDLPDADTPFPLSLDIDYIRYYQFR